MYGRDCECALNLHIFTVLFVWLISQVLALTTSCFPASTRPLLVSLDRLYASFIIFQKSTSGQAELSQGSTWLLTDIMRRGATRILSNSGKKQSTSTALEVVWNQNTPQQKQSTSTVLEVFLNQNTQILSNSEKMQSTSTAQQWNMEYLCVYIRNLFLNYCTESSGVELITSKINIHIGNMVYIF